MFTGKLIRWSEETHRCQIYREYTTKDTPEFTECEVGKAMNEIMKQLCEQDKETAESKSKQSKPRAEDDGQPPTTDSISAHGTPDSDAPTSSSHPLEIDRKEHLEVEADFETQKQDLQGIREGHGSIEASSRVEEAREFTLDGAVGCGNSEWVPLDSVAQAPADVLTALGQAYCRLALASSLNPRLCDDSGDGLVPEPELLRRIGLHSLELAIQRKNQIAQTTRLYAMEILDKAVPKVNAAHLTLQELTLVDMSELKSWLRQPRARLPPACLPVCDAVCVLMSLEPQIMKDRGRNVRDFVQPFRRLCDDSRVVGKCLDYDKDNIPAKCVEAVEGLIKNDENPLDPELLQKIGRVWAAFAMWAMAMVDYHHASKAVNPHREALELAQNDIGELVEAIKASQLDANE